MSAFTALRDEIYHFIIDQMGEWDYERMKDYQHCPFATWEEFCHHQRTIVDGLDPIRLNHIQWLMEEFKKSNIGVMDKEDMSDWDGDGFYFADNRMVCYHDR